MKKQDSKQSRGDTRNLRLVQAHETASTAEAGEDLTRSLLAHSDSYADQFRGTAAQLISAGLVSVNELPGQPGAAKRQMCFDASGQRLHRQGAKPVARQPGCRRIRKISSSVFEVQVALSEHERASRNLFEDRDDEISAWKVKLESANSNADAQLACIEMVRQEQLLSDAELVARARQSIAYRLNFHQEHLQKAMRAIQEARDALSLGPARRRAAAIKLVHSARWANP